MREQKLIKFIKTLTPLNCTTDNGYIIVSYRYKIEIHHHLTTELLQQVIDKHPQYKRDDSNLLFYVEDKIYFFTLDFEEYKTFHYNIVDILDRLHRTLPNRYKFQFIDDGCCSESD